MAAKVGKEGKGLEVQRKIETMCSAGQGEVKEQRGGVESGQGRRRPQQKLRRPGHLPG